MFRPQQQIWPQQTSCPLQPHILQASTHVSLARDLFLTCCRCSVRRLSRRMVALVHVPINCFGRCDPATFPAVPVRWHSLWNPVRLVDVCPELFVQEKPSTAIRIPALLHFVYLLPLLQMSLCMAVMIFYKGLFRGFRTGWTQYLSTPASVYVQPSLRDGCMSVSEPFFSVGLRELLQREGECGSSRNLET